MNTRSGVMRLKSTRYFFSSYCRDYFAPRSFSSAARKVNHKYNNPVSSIKTYLSNTLLSGRNCIKPHGRWPDNTRNHYMVIRFYSSAVEGKNVGQDNVANSVEKETVRNVGQDNVANSVEKETVRSLDDAQNNQTEKMETQKPFVECETQKKSPAMTRLARFRDEFLTRVVPCEEITDSWDNFPYYINESTKSLLSECVGSRLKHKELTRDYSGRLACSSGRIMLQSIPGTVLYRNRLVGALAREKQVPMMVLDSSFLPYILSEDELDEEIASDSEDEEESDDEDDSKTSAGTCGKCGSKYGSSKSSSSSSQSKPEKTNCLLKEGDRVKYVGPTTTSTNETKRILSTGQRGEVQEINGDKVAVIFSISDLATKETDPQPSLSWLDVEHVRHDCDAKMHDCYVSMGVLCEVLKSRQPLILYFPDSFRWLPSSASKTARREFVCYTKKMFGQLTGRVVMICGEDEWEQSRNTKKYPCSLKKLFKELSATRQCKDDGASKLFTNVVYIKPPEEEGLMKTFCEKIEEDRTRVISRSNSIEMQKVLKEHGLLCTDLDHIKTDDMILTKWKAEKIIGWATNHHLSSCLSPPLAGGLFHVPHESLKIAVSRLKEQETESKKKLSTKKNVKDLAVDEFEEEIVAAVVCPDEIGVKFDDVGALEHVKKVLNELVILPMKRPELFSRGNLLRPCKGLLLFGPPGTGKTLIAKALATEAGANFINVTATSLTSMWYGDSEKNARALFSLAGKLAPAVIFVDEIDSLLGARGGPYESGANRRLKNEFMSSWDGLNSKDSQRILVIGATNRPFDLDDAVVRRMPRRIYVDLPDVETRLKILNVLLAKENLDSGFSLEQLAEATDSYSGSDLKNLCVAAAYTPVQELLQEESKGNKVDAPSLRPLKLDDFIRSKATVVPSVSHSATSMIELRKWNEEYGEGGSRRKSPFGF